MKAGDVVKINAPGDQLDGSAGTVKWVSEPGDFARVAVGGGREYHFNTVALDPAPGACPTCGAELPGDRRKGE